jgi:hypothetical protein
LTAQSTIPDGATRHSKDLPFCIAGLMISHLPLMKNISAAESIGAQKEATQS